MVRGGDGVFACSFCRSGFRRPHGRCEGVTGGGAEGVGGMEEGGVGENGTGTEGEGNEAGQGFGAHCW
jgi:hypothetical protein